jgi:hypothetical protein
MRTDQWIDSQGQLVEDDEHYHGSISNSVVRKATAEEIEVMSTVETFMKLVKKHL